MLHFAAFRCSLSTFPSGGALRGRLESSDQLSQSGTGILGITEGMGAATTAARSLLRGMGTTLTLIENAPLLLNSLVVSQRFSSPEELLQNILAHYKVQVRPRVTNAGRWSRRSVDKRVLCFCYQAFTTPSFSRSSVGGDQRQGGLSAPVGRLAAPVEWASVWSGHLWIMRSWRRVVCNAWAVDGPPEDGVH